MLTGTNARRDKISEELVLSREITPVPAVD